MIEQLSLQIKSFIFALMFIFIYWYISLPVLALVIIILHGLSSDNGFSKLHGMIAAVLVGIIVIMVYVTVYVCDKSWEVWRIGLPVC